MEGITLATTLVTLILVGVGTLQFSFSLMVVRIVLRMGRGVRFRTVGFYAFTQLTSRCLLVLATQVFPVDRIKKGLLLIPWKVSMGEPILLGTMECVWEKSRVDRPTRRGK